MTTRSRRWLLRRAQLEALRRLIPGALLQQAPGLPLVPATPLLEEEGNLGRAALVTNVLDSCLVERTRPVPRISHVLALSI